MGLDIPLFVYNMSSPLWMRREIDWIGSHFWLVTVTSYDRIPGAFQRASLAFLNISLKLKNRLGVSLL